MADSGELKGGLANVQAGSKSLTYEGKGHRVRIPEHGPLRMMAALKGSF